MKLQKTITTNVIITFFIIILAVSVASCKRGSSDKELYTLESTLDTEADVAYKAYEALVHYIEGKDIRWSSYEELVYFSDAPSYVHEKMIGDAKMTHDAENQTLSFEANPYYHRSGKYYVRNRTGELDDFSFGICKYEDYYPILITARWNNARILEITCSANPVTHTDWYVEFFLHHDESNVTVQYKIDSPREFHNIISNAIKKLPRGRRIELEEQINRRYINNSMFDGIETNNKEIEEIIQNDQSDTNSIESIVIESLDDYPVSERVLTEKDIQGLSTSELRLLRNTIFARHGRIFKDPELSDYFSLKQWYHPQYEDVSTMLSEIELKNSNFLYEEELKNNYLDTDIESMSGQKKAIPIDTSEVIIQRDGVSYYLHKVLSSETILSICRYYDVTQQELYDTNKDALESGLIVGMYLLIPYHKGAEPMNAEPVYQKEEENAPIISSDSSDSHVLTDTDELLTHKVKWNENLYSIAKKYGVDPALILRANHLTSVDLKTGQVIIIPTN